jgi:hypothetical protein
METLVSFLVYLTVGLNLIMSIIIVIWNLYFYVKMKGIEDERWTKLLYASVGLGWCIRYALFALDVSPFGHTDQFNFPLIILTTLTLLSLAVGSIIRVQRLGGFLLIRSDVSCFIEKIKCLLKKF